MKKYKVTTEVLFAAKAGDQAAQTVIYNAFKKSILFNHLKGDEDVYQNVMICLFAKLHGINEPRHFYYYLVMAAKNAMRSKYNSNINKKDMLTESYDTSYSFDEFFANDVDDERLPDIKDILKLLKKNNKVSARDFDIYNSYYFFGYNLKEIGELYSITNERVRQINYRTTQKIKKKMKINAGL
jgi:RNA polymerase sigma factor (sigma-70 family)